MVFRPVLPPKLSIFCPPTKLRTRSCDSSPMLEGLKRLDSTGLRDIIEVLVGPYGLLLLV